MNLFPALEKVYTKDSLSAKDAQRFAELIAFAPIVFQASRLMVKFGILEALRDSDDGLSFEQVSEQCGISLYGAKVLLEASLSIGTIRIDKATDRFHLSKTGWFLLNDPATKVNMDFNHDVNYLGFFKLEEAIKEGRPAGLEHFGSWPTIYEGLSSLPEEAQRSWFAFDHFYSDNSFEEALGIVFERNPRRIMDVGGNTGRWALRCVSYSPTVEVTIVDLPQQIAMMKESTKGKEGADRIFSHPMNLLDRSGHFPASPSFDIIWMSQFLDCFSEEEILSILSRTREVMVPETRLMIMETFWDRQRFEPASFCLTMTSLYFTAMANGNSKMYHSDDMARLVREAGMEIETIHDNLGQGHSIMVCKAV